ncbi:sensor histidine kinase [Actinophytocola sp.]|uniref:sensor histidine kinase n=1 Tax=Actinophytocola sp. TaxID=1872138 RepID=UPI00389A7DA2
MLLRSRVALTNACVVAVAIAAISTITWIVTNHNLRAQLDESLLGALPPAGAQQQAPFPDPSLICDTTAPTQDLQRFLEGVQVLRADGSTCTPSGVDPVLTEKADHLVRSATLRDGQTRSGKPVRVLLQPVGDGVVIAVSRSLTEIQNTLSGLGNVLVIASFLGAVLTAAAGLLMTRTALAPMERLTETAEEIARSENLDIPVDVSGRDEVGRLGRAFTAMTAALAESRRRQRALVDDAAHELRTPLTSLRTNVDLLVRSDRTGRPLPPEHHSKILDRLQVQTREFGDLVGELVLLARDERELARDHVQMCGVVERAVRRARSRARDHRFEIHCAPWSVIGDAVALERTVLNLLDNAVKFTPASSTVTIESTTGLLTVSDEGPGLAPEQWTQAFERFWRSPHARALPGSGLGLAIVADTINAHGGTVRFTEPPNGRGACVRIELPPG